MADATRPAVVLVTPSYNGEWDRDRKTRRGEEGSFADCYRPEKILKDDSKIRKVQYNTVGGVADIQDSPRCPRTSCSEGCGQQRFALNRCHPIRFAQTFREGVDIFQFQIL